MEFCKCQSVFIVLKQVVSLYWSPFTTQSTILYPSVPSHRPRMLVTSHNKMVMSSFLHVFEGVPLHEVSLTTLHDPNYRTVEEAASRVICICVFTCVCMFIRLYVCLFNNCSCECQNKVGLKS